MYKKEWCTCKVVSSSSYLNLLLFCRSRCLSYLLFTSVPSQSTLRACVSPASFGLVRTTRSCMLWNLMLANKLLIIDNCKFTASWPKKYVFRACDFIRSYKATDKINLKFNYQAEQFSIFLEFFLSLQSFVSSAAVLFNPLFNVLSVYVHVSLNLVVSSYWLNLARYRDTA